MEGKSRESQEWLTHVYNSRNSYVFSLLVARPRRIGFLSNTVFTTALPPGLKRCAGRSPMINHLAAGSFAARRQSRIHCSTSQRSKCAPATTCCMVDRERRIHRVNVAGPCFASTGFVGLMLSARRPGAGRCRSRWLPRRSACRWSPYSQRPLSPCRYRWQIRSVLWG